MDLSVGSIVVASPQQVSTDLGGEAVILELRSGVYYGLDAVGARIWDLIRQPRTLAAIRDVIVDEYEVEAERCKRDLLALVADLVARGLAEVRDEQAAPPG